MARCAACTCCASSGGVGSDSGSVRTAAFLQPPRGKRAAAAAGRPSPWDRRRAPARTLTRESTYFAESDPPVRTNPPACIKPRVRRPPRFRKILRTCGAGACSSATPAVRARAIPFPPPRASTLPRLPTATRSMCLCQSLPCSPTASAASSWGSSPPCSLSARAPAAPCPSPAQACPRSSTCRPCRWAGCSRPSPGPMCWPTSLPAGWSTGLAPNASCCSAWCCGPSARHCRARPPGSARLSRHCWRCAS